MIHDASAQLGENVCAAVRELRKRLNLTQTEFGKRIGRALPTVQRYENYLAPAGAVLLDLARLAEQHEFSDLVEVFREADDGSVATSTRATGVVGVLLQHSERDLALASKDPKKLDAADLAVRKAIAVLQRVAPQSERDRDARDQEELRRAVRTLRARLEMTQTELGSQIGKGLATVQRYESLAAPSGGVLGHLGSLAASRGHMDLYRVFQTALRFELARLEDGIQVLQFQQALMAVRKSILAAKLERTPKEMDKHIQSAKEELRKAIAALKQRTPI